MAAVMAAACRLSRVASRTPAVAAACRRLDGGAATASLMIGSTMKASSRPPASHITTVNQGQPRRAPPGAGLLIRGSAAGPLRDQRLQRGGHLAVAAGQRR